MTTMLSIIFLRKAVITHYVSVFMVITLQTQSSRYTCMNIYPDDTHNTWKTRKEHFYIFEQMPQEMAANDRWSGKSKKLEKAILTGIWDVAVIVLGVHAILEDRVKFIFGQLLSCGQKRMSHFPSGTKLSNYRIIPRASKLWFNSASSIVPSSFLSYSLRHSRKSSKHPCSFSFLT